MERFHPEMWPATSRDSLVVVTVVTSWSARPSVFVFECGKPRTLVDEPRLAMEELPDTGSFYRDAA